MPQNTLWLMGKTGLNEDDEMEFVSKKLYVKYMVSLRCKTIVKSELGNLDLSYRISPHGALEFSEEISADQYAILNKALRRSGMILLNDSESMLIDKIINTIVEVIHNSDSLPKLNFSDLINEHAVVGDESILKIFSDVKGMSVLQFIILQKIERIKELLLYEDMSLPEIAELLNYKNQDYLVAQFKNSTGLTPTYFKRLKKDRMAIAKRSLKSVQKAVSG